MWRVKSSRLKTPMKDWLSCNQLNKERVNFKNCFMRTLSASCLVFRVCDKDVDECSDPSKHKCSKEATCTDTVGSFICSCNAGFNGNGVSCDSEWCYSFETENLRPLKKTRPALLSGNWTEKDWVLVELERQCFLQIFKTYKCKG